jgi:hypothetical protein
MSSVFLSIKSKGNLKNRLRTKKISYLSRMKQINKYEFRFKILNFFYRGALPTDTCDYYLKLVLAFAIIAVSFCVGILTLNGIYLSIHELFKNGFHSFLSLLSHKKTLSDFDGSSIVIFEVVSYIASVILFLVFLMTLDIPMKLFNKCEKIKKSLCKPVSYN